MPHFLLIAKAGARTAARTVAKLDDPQGDGAFLAALSPTGANPPTDYACAWAQTRNLGRFRDRWAVLIAAGEVTMVEYDLRNDPDTPSRTFAAMGLRGIAQGAP